MVPACHGAGICIGVGHIMAQLIIIIIYQTCIALNLRIANSKARQSRSVTNIIKRGQKGVRDQDDNRLS